jgi:glycosyltransferase involved in cell wall biosynthesis/2-polyprenyl-3-methyl-5-hydroxy-6-metoxy-1,4-benzoquinol methylase
MKNTFCKVLVLDMQPIDPPIGGGRLRLLGLYHDLGLPTTYVGTYDWPGEKFRDHRLSSSLREINIPLSEKHFDAVRKIQNQVNGKTIIDTTFHQLAHLSPDFIVGAKKEIDLADVVIVSHPWVFPLVCEHINSKKSLLIYDSQNVEGFLRYTLLEDTPAGKEIAREVIRIEYELCHAADIILACSAEDRRLYKHLYGIPSGKIKVVPNGVFTRKVTPVGKDEKKNIRQKLGLSGETVAIFIGSNYQPNVEAAQFIIQDLAPKLPETVFVIAGGVGNGINKDDIKALPNVVITGFLSDDDKVHYLAASDIAVNPMVSGSGTNIKMFDFMAAGLPILSTEIGARGIEEGTSQVIQLCDAHTFSDAIKSILHDEKKRDLMALAARQLAEEKYSWENISNNLGILVSRYYAGHLGKQPFFSVIIPSYERHDNLNKLMKALSQQSCRDFEVIIVDQSKTLWDQASADFGLDILYIHREVKGATKARNAAAFFARGEFLAFTDDDCIPAPDWLSNAKKLFRGDNIIGIEGLIKSDKLNDPAYRPVTNEGFPGIGFMTANLFLKTEVFNGINGFDERFDNPHFREDTDLAWRALEWGDIPFSNGVMVLHPAHPRQIERESLVERNKFFEKDALLLKKHPKKYMELFLKEQHWQNTPGFWENFMLGAKKYYVNPDKYGIMRYHPVAQKETRIQPISDAIALENDMPNMQDLSAVLANQIQVSQINLSTTIPPEIQTHLPAVANITGKVKKIIGDKTHGGYFDSSVERYNHYFSIAAAYLPKGATILDIGNAPGHVAIGLHLMGMRIQGLNLDATWQSTYPSPEWLKTFNVITSDIEKNKLPFEDNLFDAIYFTEVLEHIAITNPVDILSDFPRVLKPGGILVLSTPNICNISNIYALIKGKNIFWPNDLFYEGGLDRHNREYTPDEVHEVVLKAGFNKITMYGFNCQSNWRSEGAEFAENAIRKFGDKHPLIRNTIMVIASKSLK